MRTSSFNDCESFGIIITTTTIIIITIIIFFVAIVIGVLGAVTKNLMMWSITKIGTPLILNILYAEIILTLIINILSYYMAMSQKDWKQTNSRIWLAKIDLDRGLDFPI